MATWERGAAAAIVGLAVFQLCSLWRESAPSLSELRDSVPGDATHQTLQDADFTVGSLAAIAGVSMAVLTKDYTVLILLLASYGALTLWYHAVLNRNPPTL